MLFRLQSLKFLDFQAVKDPERAEAKKRGKFTAVAKPKGAAAAAAGAAGGGGGGEVCVCLCLSLVFCFAVLASVGVAS